MPSAALTLGWRIVHASPEEQALLEAHGFGSPEGAVKRSTSYIEGQNLTMRMSMRRFTQLTNGFGKMLSNHTAAVVLHHMHYKIARIHRTPHLMPAMEAGLSNYVWCIEEIIGLFDRAGRSRPHEPAVLRARFRRARRF
jgi:hypothetical protein